MLLQTACVVQSSTLKIVEMLLNEISGYQFRLLKAGLTLPVTGNSTKLDMMPELLTSLRVTYTYFCGNNGVVCQSGVIG